MRPDISRVFIENVERCRKQRDLSKKDLADRLGVKPSGIAKLLYEKTNPRLKTIQAVSDALGIQPWELIKSEGQIPVSPHTLQDCLRVVNEAATGKPVEFEFQLPDNTNIIMKPGTVQGVLEKALNARDFIPSDILETLSQLDESHRKLIIDQFRLVLKANTGAVNKDPKSQAK